MANKIIISKVIYIPFKILNRIKRIIKHYVKTEQEANNLLQEILEILNINKE